jgi:hypothetical protein
MPRTQRGLVGADQFMNAVDAHAGPRRPGSDHAVDLLTRLAREKAPIIATCWEPAGCEMGVATSQTSGVSWYSKRHSITPTERVRRRRGEDAVQSRGEALEMRKWPRPVPGQARGPGFESPMLHQKLNSKLALGDAERQHFDQFDH